MVPISFPYAFRDALSMVMLFVGFGDNYLIMRSTRRVSGFVPALHCTYIFSFKISSLSSVWNIYALKKHLLTTNGRPNGFSLIFPAEWVSAWTTTGKGPLTGSAAPRGHPQPPARLAHELFCVLFPGFSQSV